MGELAGERRRETEKEEEIYRKREGGVKQMCQNCISKMNMNTLWNVYSCFYNTYKHYRTF